MLQEYRRATVTPRMTGPTFSKTLSMTKEESIFQASPRIRCSFTATSSTSTRLVRDRIRSAFRRRRPCSLIPSTRTTRSPFTTLSIRFCASRPTENFKGSNFFFLRRLQVGGEKISLYDFENRAIRPLGEERIHAFTYKKIRVAKLDSVRVWRALTTSSTPNKPARSTDRRSTRQFHSDFCLNIESP